MHKIGFTNVCKNCTIIVLKPNEATGQDSFEIEKVVKKEFSRTKDTLRTLHETLRKEFQTPNDIKTRLRIAFPKNTYGIELLNMSWRYYDNNLEKLGVYPGDIIMIEPEESFSSCLSLTGFLFPAMGGRPRQI